LSSKIRNQTSPSPLISSGKENKAYLIKRVPPDGHHYDSELSISSNVDSLPHDARTYQMTSIKKRFTHVPPPLPNFHNIALIKVIQALGDKESFALIPGQSFLTNSILQSSGAVSSANFQEIEELRNNLHPLSSQLSSTLFVIDGRFNHRGGPRMGSVGHRSQFLAKFINVFNKGGAVRSGVVVASTASCVDTPEIEEESPQIKEAECEKEEDDHEIEMIEPHELMETQA
jgi:hypothetical protein